MSFGHILFGFSGRMNRGKYWLAVVFWTLVFFVACGVVVFFIARDAATFSADNVLQYILAYGAGLIIFVLVVWIPMIVSGFAIGIKRLHDRGRSGWWILVFYFGPWVFNAIASVTDSTPASFALSLAGLVVGIWGLVELGFLRGTRGPNQYGPDPLAPEQVPATR